MVLVWCWCGSGVVSQSAELFAWFCSLVTAEERCGPGVMWCRVVLCGAGVMLMWYCVVVALVWYFCGVARVTGAGFVWYPKK